MTAPTIALRKIDDLTPDPRNARTHGYDQIEQVASSIARFGWTNPVLADDLIRAGHGRVAAARLIYERGEVIYLAPGEANGGVAIPKGTVPVIDCTGWSEDDRKAYSLADNQLALLAGWDQAILLAQIEELQAVEFDLDIIGFDQGALDALAGVGAEVEETPPAGQKSGAGSLATEFLIPPFTILNAREGWWMDRKRAWLSLGIKSEVGRGENLIGRSLHEQVAMALSGKGSGGSGASYDGAKKYIDERRAVGMPDPDILREAQGKASNKGRAFGQDFMRGEPGSIPLDRVGQATKERAGGRKNGLGGVTMDALSSHPRYYEQKTAAEAKVGRKLSPEEFERDHWVLPDSELSSGTSIFDPVLCELAYRWFSPPGGRILDPFAGGSVRGIVAAALGRHYVGIDLRPEQVEANREQWPVVAKTIGAPARQGEEVPPLAVDEIEGFQIVRDDRVLGGTKRRALDRLVATIEADELVYATPAYGFAQIALAGACRAAGKKATIFVAARSERHPRTQAAADLGAEIIEVKAGRLNVIQSRARKHCEATGAYQVPFGMDDEMFVSAMAEVISELPGEAPREVWCVAGSGVLTRALQRAFPDASHHAVQIGREPKVGDATLWKAPEEFEDDALDPPPFPSCSNYDAKAWQFMRENAAPGALFWNLGADPAPATVPHDLGEPVWIEGDSRDVLSARHEGEADLVGEGFDFIFSCPPYGDLEVYSDDPADISTLEMAEFDLAYEAIIGRAAARLADNRFACFVVGDYRDKKDGIYRNFVSKTIQAFERAGMGLYNEAILVTSVGSLPIRTAKQFRSTRKFGKTHQNVLVFVKGNPRLAVEALGAVDVGAGMDRLLEDLADQPGEE